MKRALACVRTEKIGKTDKPFPKNGKKKGFFLKNGKKIFYSRRYDLTARLKIEYN